MYSFDDTDRKYNCRGVTQRLRPNNLAVEVRERRCCVNWQPLMTRLKN